MYKTPMTNNIIELTKPKLKEIKIFFRYIY